MNKKRENNLELLRLVSTIAVITIHVSSTYIGVITNAKPMGVVYTNHILYTCLFEVLSRFAVPCFIMLTGAFALADEKNLDYTCYYRRVVKSSGIPMILFSVIYVIYAEVVAVLSVPETGISDLLTPIKDAIKGRPFYHMWYLYMMIFLWLLIPFIIYLKQRIGEKGFVYVSWILLIAGSIGTVTSTDKLSWDIGASIRYVGYLMVGYVIRKYALNRKSKLKGVLLLLFGTFILLLLAGVRYYQFTSGMGDAELPFSYVSALSPPIVVASTLIFAGFSLLEIKRDVTKISSKTLLIYLIHGGVWDVGRRCVYRIGLNGDNRLIIPIGIILTFVISFGLSFCFEFLWKKIDRDSVVTNKVCKLLHLN